MDFANSETKINLLRAFAGESQARNRYEFAAEKAKEQNQFVIESVFKFTANQEKQHAKIFMNHLKEFNGENVKIDGAYPVEVTDTIVELLKNAHHNEFEEYEVVYKNFGEKAKEEGFLKIASSFNLIAEIEKTHGERYAKFAKYIEEGKLFVSDIECSWMCLNCGYVHKGKKAPDVCPVCSQNQGYFIRLELAPVSK